MFLFTLLSGDRDSTKNCSAPVARVANSFAQDLIFGVTSGNIKPPKQILQPFVVKTLTNNVELVSMLNRCDHGISYSQLEEINTALCLQKMAAANTIPLPTTYNLMSAER